MSTRYGKQRPGRSRRQNNLGRHFEPLEERRLLSATNPLDVSALDGTNGFIIAGEDDGDWFGWSVASAGDVNGDGFDDVIIGARNADPYGYYGGTSKPGEAFVLFGASGGFPTQIDPSTFDGTYGFKISGTTNGDRVGQSVRTAGDVNGDGFDDMIVGTNGANEAYILFGHSGSFYATLNTNASSLNSTSYDANHIRGMFLANGGSGTGVSVSTAGDVNGDGLDDVIVGAGGLFVRKATSCSASRISDLRT